MSEKKPIYVLWTRAAIACLFSAIAPGAEPVFELQFSKPLPAQEPQPSERELERLYRDYIGGSFAEVIPEIARQFKPSPPGVFASGTSPAGWAESPWKGGRGHVLGAAWHYHTDYVARDEGLGENLETLMRIVEDRNIGLGRQIAFLDVMVRLDYGEGDPSMPPYEEVTARLGKIAGDPTEEHELRTRMVPIVFEHGDPNGWLDTAIALSALEKDAVSKGEAFRRMAPSLYTGKLTAANRAKYLNHAFGLLEAMDDGRSGIGYFLADELSQAIVIPLGRTDTNFFRSAVDRPEFHDGQNLSPAFFQFPVDSARAWWREHRHEYVTKPAAGGKSAAISRPRKPRGREAPSPTEKESEAIVAVRKGRTVFWMLVVALVAAVMARRYWVRSSAG